MAKSLPPENALGRHVLLELYDCDADLLKYPPQSERILLDAAAAMGATIMGSHFHAFPEHGVSGVVVIAESHLTIHTWPEKRYAAVDVFSCGALDLEAGIGLLTLEFGAERVEQQLVLRGVGL
ncbi:adenosylmethionine decarboxylase [Lewinella sp. 4G2]|uniref:adenosylmethionine decarboxylase n=1 Tax=Lewinella sp. 4G2 TaxID=1803372 RepID=UPI0007B46466|nr:adenosylmethionine decarboxylase [Lewinella sp. 4G2]OAV44110.1 S-adenosylmethionine decarboxylase proenzyme [Lewinella sp. 4G2]